MSTTRTRSGRENYAAAADCINNEESATDTDTDSVIDILASVDDGAADHLDGTVERMVSRREDDWLRTVAGVAGNVLEW